MMEMENIISAFAMMGLALVVAAFNFLGECIWKTTQNSKEVKVESNAGTLAVAPMDKYHADEPETEVL
jgi:hypothetical protein